jgi:TonB family protein
MIGISMHSSNSGRMSFRHLPSIDERFGRAFLASVGVHGIVFLLAIWGWRLFPSTAIQMGSGPGGGQGIDLSAVGVVDELSGGVGMIKPSIVPQPPALMDQALRAQKDKAIPIPQTIEPKKKLTEQEAKQAAKVNPKAGLIPTAPEPGSGGAGGRSGGSGGGIGGGSGVSIGTGSGGFGDSWYARTVEARISSNWTRPPGGVRVEITYSFYIASDGTINGLKQERSSGNPELDLMAERAISASNPLAPPPPEFRGKLIQFVAQFVYPPNP